LAPRLIDLARIPSPTPEPLPEDREAEIMGAAVGAVALALTAHVPVVVYAGLHPGDAASPRARALNSLRSVLGRPGTVLVMAGEAREEESFPGERTLVLEPMTSHALSELAERWGIADPKWAMYAHRVTRGHSFFVQELVRWLEESGCLRIDDERETVALLDPVARMPVPISLDAVLQGRFQRLDHGARYVLDLIARHDGELTLEELRARYEGRDDGFDQALATLRRRGFLLHRAALRPVALSSPLWHDVIEPPSRRKFKRRRTRTHPLEPVLGPHRSTSHLARILDGIPEAARRLNETPHDPPVALLAGLWRGTRRREGAGWDGARGRIAVLSARLREHQNRPVPAMRWGLWCLDHLPADHHPVLRRAGASVLLRCLEQAGLAERAASTRRQLLEEALLAGHLVIAALLRAAVAEGDRRLAGLDTAVSEAGAARIELETMGLGDEADLAGVTRLLALVDLRRWDAAAAVAETLPLETGDWSWLTDDDRPRETAQLLRERYSRPLPHGWGWGLDDAMPLEKARARLALAWPRDVPDQPDPILAGSLRRTGRNILAADLWEMAAQRPPENTDPASRERAATLAVSLNRELGHDSRLRDLAHALRGTPAAEGAAFDPLRRFLLTGAAPRDPAPADIVIRVLGPGRVDRGGTVWPRGLWPEWWLRVLGRVLSLEILGLPMSGDDLLAAVSESGQEPGTETGPWVERFNRLLWGETRRRGGLDPTGAGIRWNRGGVRCDALAVLEDEPADDLLPDPSRVAGMFLPGLEGREETRARGVLAARVTAWIRTWMRDDPGMEAARYTALLEGPARMVDLGPLLAPRLRIRGWSRTADALRRGSPSEEA